MKIGEYKAAKDQMSAMKKKLAVEKRKMEDEDTVFSPMKRVLAGSDVRSRATARAAARARLKFAQTAQ